MSPFIIFAIVLTIAEILYFSAAIYMELHAKSRKDCDSTENIPLEDEDDGAVVRPRTVTENAETGGFDITGTSSSPEQEQITEADETDITAKAEEELLPASDAPESTGADGRPAVSNESQEAHSESAPQEKFSAPDNSEVLIPSVGFIDGQKPEQEARPFVEAEVFNQELVEPQYEVRSCVGTSANDEIAQRLEGINKNMKKNTILGNLFKSKDLSNIIRNNAESLNIDKRDEYTQC